MILSAHDRRRIPRHQDSGGFSLLELLIGVAVIGILASVSLPAYQKFTQRAKMVEAELALADIRRLQDLYFNDNLAYTTNLQALGFNPNPPLKNYAITIQLGTGKPKKNPILYQAFAVGDLDPSKALDAWVLTLYADHSVVLDHGCIPKGKGLKVNYNCVE